MNSFDSSRSADNHPSDAPEIQRWVESVHKWLWHNQEELDEPAFTESIQLRAPEENFWSFFLFEPLSEAVDHLVHKDASQPGGAVDVSNDSANGGEKGLSAFRPRLNFLLQHWSGWLLKALHDAVIEENQEFELAIYQHIAGFYAKLHAANMPLVEGPILQILSWNRHSAGLRMMSELLIENPPHDWSATAIAISPLMRSKEWNPSDLFPRLMAATEHPTTIAPLIDLTNFVTRQGLVASHPALDKKSEWISLLGGVVARLGLLEEAPHQFGESVAQVQHVLSESVALCVSLCDAIGWFGDTTAIGKLNQALELSHRRVKTEAAAALARLGNEEGTQALIALAKEPSARLRVLTYAEELMISDRIDPQWNTTEARAESELAIWLGQPQQFGLPPTSLQRIDQRFLYWPGYDDPCECFLFRYTYQMGEAEISNVGIAGPMVHSFAADLANLPENDIYAVFAGWCAEHHDIYEVDVENFNPAQQSEAKRLISHMELEGLSEVRPMYLGFFVGERALVAMAQRNQKDGIAVSDGLELLWFPTEGRVRPLGHLEVYSIYKGRKILRTFNTGLEVVES